MSHKIILAEYVANEKDVEKILPFLQQMQAFCAKEEPGCISYTAGLDTEKRGHIVLFEVYKDEAAIAAHRETPYFKEIVAGKILPLLISRKVTRLNGM